MLVPFWEKLALPLAARVSRYDMWDRLKAGDALYASPRPEREASADSRLRALLEHAYANVPHYRRKFDSVGLVPADIRTMQDLRRLPITTKAEIQAAFPHDMVARNYRDARLRSSQSGATSGPPLDVRMDFGAVMGKYAEITRHEIMNGWHVGDRTVHSLPCPYVDYYVRGIIEEGTFTEGLAHLARLRKESKSDFMWYLENYVVFPLLHRRLLLYPVIGLDGVVDDALTTDHLRRLSRFRPKMVRSHPLYAYLWARRAEQQGGTPPPMEAVELTGGLASRAMKTMVERGLRTRTYDYYGSAEIGGIAAECHQRRGMHVYENILHMEFLVGDRPAEPEETGSIVITDLLNHAMPFIRYWTDDVGRYHARDACACGLDTVRMEVEGRSWEMVVDRHGKEWTAEQVMDAIWSWGDLYLYQLTLDEPGRATLHVLEDRQPDKAVNAAVAGLSDLLGPSWSVRAHLTDRIPPAARGKYCFVKARYTCPLPQLFPGGRPEPGATRSAPDAG